MMDIPLILEPTPLADGRVVAIIPLTFGRARITLARAGDLTGYDDSW